MNTLSRTTCSKLVIMIFFFQARGACTPTRYIRTVYILYSTHVTRASERSSPWASGGEHGYRCSIVVYRGLKVTANRLRPMGGLRAASTTKSFSSRYIKKCVHTRVSRTKRELRVCTWVRVYIDIDIRTFVQTQSLA